MGSIRNGKTEETWRGAVPAIVGGLGLCLSRPLRLWLGLCCRSRPWLFLRRLFDNRIGRSARKAERHIHARIGRRTPNRKRDLNPPGNTLWDSDATPVHASRIDSRSLFLERAMYEKTLVFTLLIANLTNVVCLYAYL